MVNQKMLEALYLHGPMGFYELSLISGLDYSDIAIQGFYLSNGGLVDFDTESHIWSYVEDAWLQ